MMSKGSQKINMYQEFVERELQRGSMNINGSVDVLLDFQEVSIRSEFDKASKRESKYKNKKKSMVSPEFIRAYNELSSAEKIDLYCRTVLFIKDVLAGTFNEPKCTGDMATSEGYTRSFSLKTWKRKDLRLDKSKNLIYCAKNERVKLYDLNNYLIRESKSKENYSFVLEAINSKPTEKNRTVHIGFKDSKLFADWFQAVRVAIVELERTRILRDLGIDATVFGLKSGKSLDESIRMLNLDMSDSMSISTSRGYESEIASLDESDFGGSVTDRTHSVNSSTSKYGSDLKTVQGLPNNHNNPTAFEPWTPGSFKKVPGSGSNPTSKMIPSAQQQQQSTTITSKFVESPSKNSNQQQSDDSPTIKQLKTNNKSNDIFRQILPDYDISSINSEESYTLIQNQSQARILQNQQTPNKYKFFMVVSQQSQERIVQPMACAETYPKWNSAVEESSVKTMIKSENTAIIYLKHKPFSKLYRARDFVFVRHLFKKDNCLYMVDNSIENENYPPFITIVRGNITVVWCIRAIKNGVTTVVADIEIRNQGYLSASQDHNLTMNYLRGFFNIPGYILQRGYLENKVVMFDLNWDETQQQKQTKVATSSVIQQNGQKKQQSKTNNSKAAEQPREISNKQVYREQNTTKKEPQKEVTGQKVQVIAPQTRSAIVDEEKGELDPSQIAPSPLISIAYEFDEKGYVKISGSFIRANYSFTPVPSAPSNLQEVVNGHHIWKGEWIFDKSGGIIFVNQKKIQEQKGVLKFILGMVGKNLLSGKSILNISLPVDIFAGESNLQRLAFSMTYGPLYLEKAAREKDTLQKLKHCIAFGLTNSVLYLNMEKPFNPILGQTSQTWINGCPVYFQQISHHPPIASFLMIGRGYTIHGSLESKVELHMNSGCGTTDGVYCIKFDDGTDINFVSPGGQIAGLAYGDRKFNLVGKSYYWSHKDSLFLEMTFDPHKKGFFSSGKKQTPSDYFEGQVRRVTPQFLEQFRAKRKRQGPNQKQIITDNLCKIYGTWNKQMMADGKVYMDLDKQIGYKLEYDSALLPSDSNWREDIVYRRLMNVSRAQHQKERLEVLQRADRKLREKHRKY